MDLGSGWQALADSGQCQSWARQKHNIERHQLDLKQINRQADVDVGLGVFLAT